MIIVSDAKTGSYKYIKNLMFYSTRDTECNWQPKAYNKRRKELGMLIID